MAFSAHVRGILHFFFASFVAILLLFLIPSSVLAQTTTSRQTISTPNTTQQQSPLSPNLDENVQLNQSTFIQSMMAEVMAATICQLAGVNPIDPNSPCLGINPKTHKLGYLPTNSSQANGILGISAQWIGSLYVQPITTSSYIHYLSDNFGVVKKTYAANQDGFQALSPVLDLWKVMRNLSYFLLILAFIFIGIGIMIRLRIDPRTVMSIQNQIPRIVIAILLITFSYAISAILIDLMWAITYAGINVLTSDYNPQIDTCNKTTAPLSQVATNSLLETPIIYVNDIYNTFCIRNFSLTGDSSTPMGIVNVTALISGSLVGMLDQMVKALLSNSNSEFDSCVSLGSPPVDLGACFSGLLQAVGSLVVFLVIFVAILVSLFRLWWILLRAYIFTLIYIICAPFWIVVGILPQRPLGFERWLRAIAPNLLVFPCSAWLLIFGRVMMDKFNEGGPSPYTNPNASAAVQGAATSLHDGGHHVLGLMSFLNYFVPPMVGNPAAIGSPGLDQLVAPSFGTYFAFGAIMFAPRLLDMLQKLVFKSPNAQTSGIIGGSVGMAAGIIRAPIARGMNAVTRKNPSTHMPEGALAQFVSDKKQAVARWAGGTGDKWFRRPFKRYAERQETGGNTYARLEDSGRPSPRLAAAAREMGVNQHEIFDAAARRGIKTSKYMDAKEKAANRAAEEGRGGRPVSHARKNQLFEEELARRGARPDPGGPRPGIPTAQKNPSGAINTRQGKIVLSGTINLNHSSIRGQTPRELVNDLIPGADPASSQARLAAHSALNGQKVAGEDWDKPVEQLTAGVRAKLDAYLASRFTT